MEGDFYGNGNRYRGVGDESPVIISRACPKECIEETEKLKAEVIRLQEALEKTERMWREERDKRVAAEEQVHRMYSEVPF